MRFPSGVSDVPPRLVRAAATAFRQVPHLTSYAANLSVEAAGAVRHQLQQRLGRPEKPRPVPSERAFEAGAPGTARPYVERVAEEHDVVAPEPEDLPIADWDHASMPSLRARVARLSLDELLRLRAYETEHASRLAVLTMLDNRIAKIRNS